MATNIPTHNLGEVIDACIAFIDNRRDHDRRADGDRAGAGLTGAIILGRVPASTRLTLYALGRGSIMMRGKTEIERDPQRT